MEAEDAGDTVAAMGVAASPDPSTSACCAASSVTVAANWSRAASPDPTAEASSAPEAPSARAAGASTDAARASPSPAADTARGKRDARPPSWEDIRAPFACRARSPAACPMFFSAI